ncbi:MAG: serine/threonine protein kinase, partial [Phycisphaerales bacterium]|nr:serine/threonine protein kinase [Phycisphaerales bacterium]
MDRAKLKRVFDEVRNLPAEGRARRLSSLCGGEAELIGAVEELASSLDEASGFLEERPVEGGEGPGSRVGRYRLLQVIGEGGFGTVYMAEQREPVFRRVALKIVKLGMDTRQVVARFEQERQALALMDHPCIARVLDAGATEAGRPYFVMDLVRGEPITAYCRANRLAVPERLALFEQVCGAVQHAHQKGVIHRDLKPSNILVTMVDGRPVPKVIDFGIAKAIDQRLTEKTLFTEHRALIGTPEYMSPEQADRGGVDVDTRTDIYSLGVILYELLTGLTPLDGKRLRSAAYGELQRIIREEEPPKPSTRLSAERPAQAATGERPVGPDNVAAALVRGDLDWIVMMCLEKERGRRYESASGLGADVRRHLAGEPVAAAPPSALYAARKFVRRHRWPVAAGSAVLVTLLLGLAGTAYGLVEASRQRDAANEAAEVATREAAAATAAQQAADTQRAAASAAAARSRRSLEFLSGVIGSTDSMLAANPDQSVKAVLDRAAATVGESLKDDPTGAARVRGVVGAGYLSIGEPIYAETQLRLAAEGLAAAVGEDRINLHRALWHLWQARGVQDIHDDRLVRQIEALSADLLGEVDPSYGDMARAALAAQDRGEFEKAIDAVDALVERVKGAPATQAIGRVLFAICTIGNVLDILLRIATYLPKRSRGAILFDVMVSVASLIAAANGDILGGLFVYLAM